MSNVPKVLKLNNGFSIPTLGLGTYKSFRNDVREAVQYAINIGYRHIDTAAFYENEQEIGGALKEIFKEGKVKREDLFIVTKLWNNFHEKQYVVPQMKKSLQALQLEYVDLYLIHSPFGFKVDATAFPKDNSGYSDTDYVETWEGMEDCVNLGLTKSIGLSNFNEEQIERVLEHCKVKPVVNQFEVNPNLSQAELIQFCKNKNLVVTSYSPLERVGAILDHTYPALSIQDPKVIEIGKKYDKSAAQVILRYVNSDQLWKTIGVLRRSGSNYDIYYNSLYAK